jgi:hypothetical protein
MAELVERWFVGGSAHGRKLKVVSGPHIDVPRTALASYELTPGPVKVLPFDVDRYTLRRSHALIAGGRLELRYYALDTLDDREAHDHMMQLMWETMGARPLWIPLPPPVVEEY